MGVGCCPCQARHGQDSAIRQSNWGQSFGFEITEHRKHCLLNGLDEIGLTLAQADQIKAFETKHRSAQPWLFQD